MVIPKPIDGISIPLPVTPNLLIDIIIDGVYKFKIKAISLEGNTASKEIEIKVNSGANKTLTLNSSKATNTTD